MTGIKVWDGVAWQTVTHIVGPPGPQGPQGVGMNPSGAAGGALSGFYPNPTIDRSESGGLMACQRIWGTNNAYKAITSGQNVTTNAAGTIPLAVSYTPPVDAWWEVDARVSIVQKLDAAYNYLYFWITLNVVDQDGQQQVGCIYVQHSTVQTFNNRVASMWWRLAANTAYTCTASMTMDAGTWQYHQAKEHLFMSGRAFAQ